MASGSWGRCRASLLEFHFKVFWVDHFSGKQKGLDIELFLTNPLRTYFCLEPSKRGAKPQNDTPRCSTLGVIEFFLASRGGHGDWLNTC